MEVLPEGLQDPEGLGRLLWVPGEGNFLSWQGKELVLFARPRDGAQPDLRGGAARRGATVRRGLGLELQ